MRETLFYIPDMTSALQYAAAQLCKWGFDITPFPSPNVTHVLLPVPSTSMPIPATLPDDIIVFGGNIGNAPYKTIDLLQDETYLAQNAAITIQKPNETDGFRPSVPTATRRETIFLPNISNFSFLEIKT